MESQDRQAIDGLFSRLHEAERSAGARDPGADAHIREHVARQPNAPYFMAQTIVVQEYALEQAQRRIEELERRAPAGGGFLASIFGGGQSPAARQPAPSMAAPMPAQMAPGQQGGGFLAGAAQTAMGVAGGVLLGNMIGGMFGAGEAKAAEPSAADDSADDDEGGFFEGAFGDDDGDH